MTKEEILNDVFGNHGMEDCQREITMKPFRAVEEAMDSYSRQMAIAFAEWVAKENKFRIDDQWNQSLSQNVGELYNLFLQQI